jgi:hypothetical protein
LPEDSLGMQAADMGAQAQLWNFDPAQIGRRHRVMMRTFFGMMEPID